MAIGRFKYLLDASLLTITAGRVFRISPPSEGSKSTHHTSPRGIRPIRGGISHYALGPFQRVALTPGIESHIAICHAEALVLTPVFPIAKLLGEAADHSEDSRSKACASPSHL
jgi:hypothetical protein